MAIDVDNRLAGLLIPVFALRSNGDLGIGDTKSVSEAIDFCARNEIGVLQLLPINETGGDNSPYNAISSIALDPVTLSLSPQSVPLIDQSFYDKKLSEFKIDELRTGSVKYPLVKKLKTELLEHAFERFKEEKEGKEKETAQSFAQFKEENKDWLLGYSLFRTLVDEHNGDARWTLWEPEWQTHAISGETLKSSPRANELKEKAEFWSFVQYLCAKQWLEVKAHADQSSIALMGDIPFGISRYSADTWTYPELFDLEWCGGSPPETLFQGDQFVTKWGQNWGIPLYQWDAHRDTDFDWWRKRIKHVTKIFNYFRIDHVLGFYRIYGFPWIPERNVEFTELTKDEARKVTGGELPHFVPRDDQSDENKALNCKEGEALLKVVIDAAGSAGLVAEDLGTVPDYVRPSLTKLGIPGFGIPIFDRFYDTDRSYIPKEEMPKLKLGTWGTHDHVPLATFYENLVTWWHGSDGNEGWLEVKRLMKYLGLDENNPPTKFDFDLLKVFFESLLTAPCWLAVFMITDLFGLKQRYNEPGISGEDNWSQRLEFPLTHYEKHEPYAKYIATFKQLIEKSNRVPKKKVLTSTTKNN